ncbi:CdaR family protein [Clostridium rectalis]|uniref:CdaR family protein n=1 Tax=Clostridium rectalis TaxID=2040295 RepID=UPI000F63C046|nr:CdaR family protein [Clostridium rectalis]
MDEKNKRQDIMVKICCVITAFGLWLYTTSVVNPIRTYKKSIPVTIINEEALSKYNLALVPNQNFYITLNLKGTATDIYSVKENDFKIIIDLGAYVLQKGENNIPVKIVKSPNNIDIVNKDNLWVKVQLDDLIEKTVPLKVKLTGKTKDGYNATTPTTKLSTVTVRGASNFVKKVDRAEATYDISNAYKDIDANVPIVAVDVNGNKVDQIKVKPTFVTMNIPIRRVKSVGVNIKTTGTLSGNKVLKSLVSYPEKLEIAGDERVIDNITALDTEFIDLNSISSDEVNVRLVIPKGVTLINNNGYVKVKISSDSNSNNNENNIIKKDFIVNVTALNENSEYTTSLDVNQVSITVSGDNNIIENLKAEDIKCNVDVAGLGEGSHSVIVKVIVSDGVKVVSTSPQSITVDIKKKVVSEGENAN